MASVNEHAHFDVGVAQSQRLAVVQYSNSPPVPEQAPEQAPNLAVTRKEDAVNPMVRRYGFRNVQEVGIYISVVLFILSTTTLGVILAVRKHTTTITTTGSSTSAIPIVYRLPSVHFRPVPTVTIITNQEELDIIVDSISSNQILSEVVSSIIPTTVDKLILAATTNTDIDATGNITMSQTPFLLAANHIILNDSTNVKEHVVQRYALAVIYYTFQGDTWYNNTNWLSDDNYCNWYGVICCGNHHNRHKQQTASISSGLCTTRDDDDIEDSSGRIIELDFYRNNLAGPISPVIALLPYLQSLHISHNKITGTIPGAAMSSLSHLLKLWASYNSLTGTIPSELTKNGVFSTMYVHGNDITGTLPSNMCTSSTALYNFGIDCNKIQCTADCCDAIRHCFQ